MNTLNLKKTVLSVASCLLMTSASWATHNAVSATQDRGQWIRDLQDVSIVFTNTNANNTKYFVMVADSASEDLGTNQNSDSITGDRVVVPYPYAGTGGAESIFVSEIGPIRAQTNYWVYIQACENSYTYTAGPVNSSLCSGWVLISGGAIQTLQLSLNPGFSAINGTNILSHQSMRVARVDNTFLSEAFVQNWRVNFTDVGTGATTLDIPNTFNPNAPAGLSITVDNAYFTARGLSFQFTPNNDYVVRENALYRFDQATTAHTPPTSPFWTNPVNPGPLTVVDKSHCAATLRIQNADNAPANPSYSNYRLCMNGPNGSCPTQDINGTGLFTDTREFLFTGLTAGSTYTVTSQVINEGGSPWNPSGLENHANIAMNSWGGSFNVSNVETNTANFNVSNLFDAGSITSWRMVINGTPVGTATLGVPPATIPLTGLAPNTVYDVQIQLTEAVGCSSSLPATPVRFTTDPFAPTDPASFSDVLAFSMTANWTDASANPSTSDYQVQRCEGGFDVAPCATFTKLNKGATSAQSLPLTGLDANKMYYVRVRTLSNTQPEGPNNLNSAWFEIGSQLTSNDVRAIRITPNPHPPLLTGRTQLFSAEVRDADNALIADQAVTWTLVGACGTLSGAGPSQTVTLTATTPTPTPTNCFLRANKNLWPQSQVPINIDASGFSVEPNYPNFTVDQPENLTGSASVRVRHNNVLDPADVTYIWSVESGPTMNVGFLPNGNNAAKNTSLTFTKAGTYVLKVTFQRGTDVQSADTPSGVVQQALARIVLSPAEITLKKGQTRNFSATGADQFGDTMPLPTLTWATSLGVINPNGANANFVAGSFGRRITITATGGNPSRTGQAIVNVDDFDVSSARAYPVPFKSSQHQQICFKGLGSVATIRIFTASGVEVFKKRVENADDSTQCPFPWDVKNSSGERLASGVYLYIIESPDAKKEGKLIIVQ